MTTENQAAVSGEPEAARATADGPLTQTEPDAPDEAGPTPPSEASTKRPKPKSVRELIEYAYAEGGKKLQINKRDLEDLKVDHSDEGVAAENQLIRSLSKGDPLLQVPSRLLALVPFVSTNRIELRSRLLDVAFAAMVSHPTFKEKAVALQSRGLGSFDGYEPLTAAAVSEAAVALSHEQLGINAEQFKDSARERLKENAVTAFELFRVLRDRWELGQFITDMSEHVWNTPKAARSGVGKQSVALASAVAVEPINILLQHFDAERKASERRERDLRGDLTRARRATAEVTERARELETALVSRDAAYQELEERHADLQDALQAARSQNVVDRSHLMDDYEILRTQILRKLTSQVALLSDGRHALQNDRVAVADEFIDRALTAIDSEVARLKDLAGRAQ